MTLLKVVVISTLVFVVLTKTTTTAATMVSTHLRSGSTVSSVPIVSSKPSISRVGERSLDSAGNYMALKTDETTSVQSMRFLVDQDNMFFSALECNIPQCKTNTTWTEQDYNPRNGTVVIPCGVCVWMDYQGDTLVLPYGIDIQGHLYFEDGYSLMIQTPFVLVQGRLEMNSTGKVTGKPSIDFLIDGTRQNIAFYPAYNNERSCPQSNGAPGLCDIGFRSITVAGGTINARGLPPSCTTWTQLQDVVQNSDTFENSVASGVGQLNSTGIDPINPNPLCQSPGPYISNDFSFDSEHWTGGYGALYHVVDGLFQTTQRKSSLDHGPTYDMVRFQNCLVAGQVYLFSAMIRLWDPFDDEGSLTPCAIDGETGCLELFLNVRTPTGRKLGGRLDRETRGHRFKNFEWSKFYTSIRFTPDQLDRTNTYQLLQLRGPQVRFNIDMDNVTFSLAPLADNSCNGNLVVNGDAQASDIHPYPMQADGGQLDVEAFGDQGNNVFRISYRFSDNDALLYEMEGASCIQARANYRISARLYAVSSDFAVPFEIQYRIYFSNGTATVVYMAANCPPSRMEWKTCESTFAIEDEVEGAQIEKANFWIETVGAPTVDFLVDDFEIEVSHAASSGIVVPSRGIEDCWYTGAEILITSHTSNATDSQVRRLVNPPIPLGNGMVRLELDNSIILPVTAQDDEGLFPVEVALLNRNIRFRANEDTTDELLGGHFVILRTPNVDQHIEGIEVVNFGQQGELGRYPIHVHLCKNANTVIAKNSVRGSNQRCVVIHGSHNTTIIENVAYDTFGHCFMTEDGGELNNKFINNLGSNTKKASRLVREGETDDSDPSTFWASNPMNEWVGNVGAGSEANGFWFELLEFVKLPTALMDTSSGMRPKRLPLTRFLNNVAHSNYRHGLKMYPHGFLPEVTAVFENFKSYKNRLDGIFFRNMENAIVSGGIFADNRIQIDFDRSDNLAMNGTRLIGSTTRYKEIISSQNKRSYLPDRIVGCELHIHTRNISQKGVTVNNITFEGFDPNYSDFTALVEIDQNSDDVHSGIFNYWTTFQNVTIKNISTPLQFDFTEAIANNYTGMYVVDLDSSMRPQGSRATGPSTAISDTQDAKAFVDVSRCFNFSSRGYFYCRNVCFRSVTFGVDPAQVDELRLLVRSLSRMTSQLYVGHQDYSDDLSDVERHDTAITDFEVLRYFTAPLPQGLYQASFVSSITGMDVWPTFVETIYEPPLCNNSFENENVSLSIPSAADSECDELIRNGAIEQSQYSAPFWLHHDTGLNVASGRGMGGTTALTDSDQDLTTGALGQYIDIRCMVRGATYFINMWVYLERNGLGVSCDYDEIACPKLMLRAKKQGARIGVSYTEYVVTVSSEFASPFNRNGWNLMQGIITIDSTLANATRAVLYLERRKQGTKLFIDNVSMSRIKKSCRELVFNGDFSQRTTVFWERDQGMLDLVSINGNNALQHSNRRNSLTSIVQRIQTGCMKEGDRYRARAKVRVLTAAGLPFGCNRNRIFGDAACPRMRLRAVYNYGSALERSFSYPEGYIASADHGLTSDGWLTLTQAFIARKNDELADQSILYIDGPTQNVTVIVDDVSITPLQKNCSQLILNGDAEMGETVEYWRLTTGSEMTRIQLINGAMGRFFMITGRQNPSDGIVQRIDSRCMVLGSKWKVTAQMKFQNKTSGLGIACDPMTNSSIRACPSVSVSAMKGGSRVEDTRSYVTYTNMFWDPNGFNKYESTYVVADLVAGGEDFLIGFVGFDPRWDFLIDDISVVPL